MDNNNIEKLNNVGGMCVNCVHKIVIFDKTNNETANKDVNLLFKYLLDASNKI